MKPVILFLGGVLASVDLTVLTREEKLQLPLLLALGMTEATDLTVPNFESCVTELKTAILAGVGGLTTPTAVVNDLCILNQTASEILTGLTTDTNAIVTTEFADCKAEFLTLFASSLVENKSANCDEVLSSSAPVVAISLASTAIAVTVLLAY